MAGLLEVLTIIVSVIGLTMVKRYRTKKYDTNFVKKLCYYAGLTIALSSFNMLIFGYCKLELESWFFYLNYVLFVTSFLSSVLFIMRISAERRFFLSTVAGFAIYFSGGVFSTITIAAIGKGMLL